MNQVEESEQQAKTQRGCDPNFGAGGNYGTAVEWSIKRIKPNLDFNYLPDVRFPSPLCPKKFTIVNSVHTGQVLLRSFSSISFSLVASIARHPQ